MNTYSKIPRAARATALTLLLALAPALAGCGGGGGTNSDGAQAGASQAGQAGAPAGGGATQDAGKLDEEIVRLERLVERNPADEDTRDELARAYVRRGDAQRAAGQLREALADYQRALRLDPDNGEAQNNAFATKGQLGGGEEQGENGEPAPPPITPNVADDDGRPTPTPTPKRQ